MGTRCPDTSPALWRKQGNPCQRLQESAEDFSTRWQSKDVDAKKIHPSTVVGNWRARASSKRLFCQAPAHQYNSHPRARTSAPYFCKIPLSSLKQLFEGSVNDRGQERQRSWLLLAVFPLPALKPGTRIFESFPTRDDLLKSRSEMWSTRHSSSWT